MTSPVLWPQILHQQTRGKYLVENIHAEKCKWENELKFDKILDCEDPPTKSKYLIKWEGLGASQQHSAFILNQLQSLKKKWTVFSTITTTTSSFNHIQTVIHDERRTTSMWYDKNNINDDVSWTSGTAATASSACHEQV